MTDVGRIAQISVSGGGVPKDAIEHAQVTVSGVEGDAHRDLAHHGGPERAVCLYSLEAIRGLVAEGHAVVPGALGENITVEGIDWAAMQPGARLLLGDCVLLQVTGFTTPCSSIKHAFKDGAFARVSQERHPGWSRVYTRVVVEGRIRRGDPARLIDAIDGRERSTSVSRASRT